MKSFKLLFLLAYFFLINITSSNAQQEKPLYHLGAYAAYNLNIHFSNFSKLGDIPNCCPKFETGTGSGFALGGIFEYPLKSNILLDIRLGFSSIGADLIKREKNIGNTLDTIFERNPSDPIVPVTADHIIYSTIYIAGIEPSVTFKPFPRFNVNVGFKAAYMLTGKLDQRETIVSPDFVTFTDGSRIRNDFKQLEIPDKNSAQFFGMVGIGYELPIGKDSYLQPEIRYFMPFTRVCKENWKASTLQMGIALKFPVYPAKVLPFIQDTIYQRDTSIIAVLGLERENITLSFRKYQTVEEETSDARYEHTIITESYKKEIPKTSALTATINAVGINPDGKRQKDPTLTIEEFEAEEGFPLLPHVFFKEGSADLTQTNMKLFTKNQINSFSEDSLPWNTLDIYSDLLNIVGRRLKNRENDKITITGCNSNQGAEAGNLDLSRKRAEAVKNYLTSVWGISSQRILIKNQNLPDNPSRTNVADGIIENQRAEIYSSGFDLLKPLYLKEIMRTSNPPSVEITPSINSEAPLKSWEIDISQEGKTLRKIKGTNKPDIQTWNVQQQPVPEFDSPVNIRLTATDDYGQTTTTDKTLNLKQVTIKKKRYEMKDDKRIERFSLIVFDFDKAEIKSDHRRILENIKSRIMPNSTVTIAGYADRMGEKEYNKELARRRIAEVQKILQIKESNLKLNPIGSDELLYDNDSPWGRSYSRTVQIIIETPVK